MVTKGNRRTPLGKTTLIPANTEVVRSLSPGIGNGLERLIALSGGNQPEWTLFMKVTRHTSYRVMFRKSSGSLLGVPTSKPKRGCLSINKGTREARLSRVITQPSRHRRLRFSPMRQTSGGAAVVVRGWESQPHGEGRQDLSFWIVEGFVNREGSR
jgi:hypothetical protein